jgi:predicted phosphate transport protein (TIGR00153 family)
MSTTNPFANLFGKSPFKALQVHMRIVLECAREIPPLFDALAAGDQEGVVAAKDRIFEKEAEADRIKNDMRGALPKSLFMPVDRRDLLEVLGYRRDADRASHGNTGFHAGADAGACPSQY